MKIKTANTSYIGLPVCPTSFFNTSTVNIRIDWGDSSVETFSSLNDANITQVEDDSGNVIANIFRHSYLSGDNYTINISGGFGSAGEEKLAFFQQSNHSNGIAQDVSGSLEKVSFDKITGIEELSNFYIHGQGDFKGFTNLVEIPNGASHLLSDSPASSIVLSANSNATMLMDKTFEDCSSLKTLNFEPQNATSCQYTFKNSCYSPSPASKINTWDMSNVTTTRGMFEGSDFNGLINSWNLSNVEDISSMFKNTTLFNRSNPQWNLSKVKDATSVFQNSKSFNKSVATWFKKDDNIAYALTGTASMFEGAEAFNRNVQGWDFSTVKNASAMFKNAKVFNKRLRKLLNKDDNITYALTDASSMFEGAEAFNQNIQGWDMTKVENASAMFKNTKVFDRNLHNLFKKDDNITYALTGTASMFEGAEAFNRNVQGWDMAKVENASAMFKNTKVFDKALDGLFKKDDNITYALTDASSMFEGAEAFNQYVQVWDTANIQDASAMFKNTKVFDKALDGLFKKDDNITYALTDASSMFEGAEAFNRNIYNWDMKKVENASAMFKNTKVFNKPIDKLFKKDDNITYALTDASSMFEGAEAFNQNIQGWDMAKVENASAMFKNTKVFDKALDGLFKKDDNITYALTDASSMFEGAKAFNRNIYNWDMVKVEDVSAMFKNNKVFDKPLANWFKKDSNTTYAVTNMKSMFEGSIFNRNLSGPDNNNDAGWDTSTVENMSYMFKDMPITLDYSVDRVLQRAVNSGKLKKSKQFLDGTNMRKGWNDTHPSSFSATAALSNNVLTIDATLVGNYDYWSYKVVNANTQSFASVSEVLVQNGDTSVDITLDPGSYEIYAKGYIS